MPTSRPINADPGRSGREARTGYSLIEILVVLAIMGLSTAIIMPNTSRMMDQATSHAVFFEFQRGVSDLRREANRTGLPLRLVDPGTPELAAVGSALSGAPAVDQIDTRRIQLRAPWRYTLAPALDIAEGGRCSATTANLVKGDEVVMTLHTSQGDCRFLRQAGVQRAPRAS